jgi:hypothetical protein
MITTPDRKASRASTADPAPKDKALELTVLSIRTILSSEIVRPKVQTPTRTITKKETLTILIPQEIIKMRTWQTARK